MKNAMIIGISAVALVLIASFFIVSSPTGFITVGGGSAQGVGEQPAANPKYGTVYGSVVWQIKEGESIIENTVPDQAVNVYFIPTGKIVDWTVPVNCTTEIKGKLKNIDADGAGTQCIQKDYESPTAYECTAKDTNSTDITIYRTTTENIETNAGCFAAKIKSGEYDIYM